MLLALLLRFYVAVLFYYAGCNAAAAGCNAAAGGGLGVGDVAVAQRIVLEYC